MIELRLVNAYYGHVQALRSVSLRVGKGEIFSVLGANGAGKTTLLKSILGLNQTSGSILFDGQELSGMATHNRVRLGIALVPEGRRLFPDFTVGQNLLIGAINRKDRKAVATEIDELCETFPILKRRFEQRAQTLSGGEGQMLALSRALLSNPKLLLLDEPSVGLMPMAVSEIFSMLGNICRERKLTVLLVEQNARKAIALADRIAVLELGRVAIEGTPSEIVGNEGIKAAYLGSD